MEQQIASPARTSLRQRLWGLAYVLLALVAVFWSGNSIVARAVRDDVPPFTLAFIRWAGALALLLPFAWSGLRRDAPLLARHWPIILALGLIGVAAFNGFLYSGLHYTTATKSLLIQSATPALVLLFQAAVFQRLPTLVQLVAVFLSMTGVAIVVTNGHPALLGRLDVGKGDALVLAGVCLWALYSVLLVFRPPVHPLSFLALTFMVGAAAMAPLALEEQAQGLHVTWNIGTAGALLYVATLPSLVAYMLYNRAIELVGPARSGQFLNLMPIIGAGLAALALGERLAFHHLIGMVVILAGIIAFAWGGRGGQARNG